MSAPGGATMSDAQLKARYLGTAPTTTGLLTKHAWLVHQHRDTAASLVAHHADQLSYMAVAQGESVGRTRLQLLEGMIRPCGPPPPTRDVEALLEQKLE